MKYQISNFCEVDKFAAISYCAMHRVKRSLNLGNIADIDYGDINDFNMICGGSPCQDFSINGNHKGTYWECDSCGYTYNPLLVPSELRPVCPQCGSETISKGRSALVVEWLNIIKEFHPNWGFYENVPTLVQDKFSTTFSSFIGELESHGYNTYYTILNATGFKVPQVRRRMYLVFIDKSLDNGLFKFPEEHMTGRRLQNILDTDVADKYYVDNPRCKSIIDNFNNGIFASQYRKDFYTIVGNIYKDCHGHGFAGNVYDTSCFAPTLTTMRGGQSQPLIIDSKRNAIRRLTPVECWRLMGYSNKAFQSARKALNKRHSSGVDKADYQLYKQAGNSIVVSVLYSVLENLYDVMPYLFDDLKIGSYFSGIGAFEFAIKKLYANLRKEQKT